MYYKPSLKHCYYYFRVCSNKYYCLLKKKSVYVINKIFKFQVFIVLNYAQKQINRSNNK